MKCKTIHKKIIFFLEGALPKEEMEQVNIHLGECNECFSFAEELKSTLGIIEVEKLPEVNPFFYTRLKARIENQASVQAIKVSPGYLRVLQPVVFSALLLLGVYSGIKIGQAPHATDSSRLLTAQEMVPYLNEMVDEPIEAFLMD